MSLQINSDIIHSGEARIKLLDSHGKSIELDRIDVKKGITTTVIWQKSAIVKRTPGMSTSVAHDIIALGLPAKASVSVVFSKGIYDGVSANNLCTLTDSKLSGLAITVIIEPGAVLIGKPGGVAHAATSSHSAQSGHTGTFPITASSTVSVVNDGLILRGPSSGGGGGYTSSSSHTSTSYKVWALNLYSMPGDFTSQGWWRSSRTWRNGNMKLSTGFGANWKGTRLSGGWSMSGSKHIRGPVKHTVTTPAKSGCNGMVNKGYNSKASYSCSSSHHKGGACGYYDTITKGLGLSEVKYHNPGSGSGPKSGSHTNGIPKLSTAEGTHINWVKKGLTNV